MRPMCQGRPRASEFDALLLPVHLGLEGLFRGFLGLGTRNAEVCGLEVGKIAEWLHVLHPGFPTVGFSVK